MKMTTFNGTKVNSEKSKVLRLLSVACRSLTSSFCGGGMIAATSTSHVLEKIL